MAPKKVQKHLKKIESFYETYKNLALSDDFKIPSSELNAISITLNNLFILEPDLAIRWFKKIILLFPNEKDLYIELAKLYILQEKPGNASTMLRKLYSEYSAIHDRKLVLEFLSQVRNLGLDDPFFMEKTVSILLGDEEYDPCVEAAVELFNVYDTRNLLKNLRTYLNPLFRFFRTHPESREYFLSKIKSVGKRNLLDFYIRTDGILPFAFTYRDLPMLYMSYTFPPPFPKIEYKLIFQFKFEDFSTYSVIFVDEDVCNKVLMPIFDNATRQSFKKCLVVVLSDRKTLKFEVPLFKSYVVGNKTDYARLLYKSYLAHQFMQFPMQSLAVLARNYHQLVSETDAYLHPVCAGIESTFSRTRSLLFHTLDIFGSRVVYMRNLIRITGAVILTGDYLALKSKQVADQRSAVSYLYGRLWKALYRIESSTETRVDSLTDRITRLKPIVSMNVHLQTQKYARLEILRNESQRIIAGEYLRFEKLASRFNFYRSHLIGTRYQELNHLVNRLVRFVQSSYGNEFEKSRYANSFRYHSRLMERQLLSEDPLGTASQLLKANIFHIEKVLQHIVHRESLHPLTNRLLYASQEDRVKNNKSFLLALNFRINDQQKDLYIKNLKDIERLNIYCDRLRKDFRMTFHQLQDQFTRVMGNLINRHNTLGVFRNKFLKSGAYFLPREPDGGNIRHLKFFMSPMEKYTNLVYRLVITAPIKSSLMHEIHYRNMYNEISSASQQTYETDVVRKTFLKKLLLILNTILFSQKILREKNEHFHNLLHRIAITQRIVPGYYDNINKLDLNFHGDQLLLNGLGFISSRLINSRKQMALAITESLNLAALKYRKLQQETDMLLRQAELSRLTTENFKRRVLDYETGMNRKTRTRFEEHSGTFIDYNARAMVNMYRTRQKTRRLFKRIKAV